MASLCCGFSDESYLDPNNNEKREYQLEESIVRADKYSLRPRTSRRSPAVDSGVGEKPKKSSKQKSVPLSKYRRKTANARERNRMREINEAFETLRSIIPHGQVQEVSGTNEKLTKITTLRSAMGYISALSAALSSSEKVENFQFDFSAYDLDSLLDSEGDSTSLSGHSLMASPDFQDSTLCSFELGTLPSFRTGFTDDTLDPSDFQDFFFT